MHPLSLQAHSLHLPRINSSTCSRGILLPHVLHGHIHMTHVWASSPTHTQQTLKYSIPEKNDKLTFDTDCPRPTPLAKVNAIVTHCCNRGIPSARTMWRFSAQCQGEIKAKMRRAPASGLRPSRLIWAKVMRYTNYNVRDFKAVFGYPVSVT